MRKQSIVPFCLAAMFVSCGVFGCGAELPGQPGRNPRRYWSDPKSIALAEAIGGGNLAEIDKLVAAGADLNAVGKEDADAMSTSLDSPPGSLTREREDYYTL
jgi:hypothetical protein